MSTDLSGGAPRIGSCLRGDPILPVVPKWSAFSPMPFWRGHVAVRDGTCPIALTPIVHYTLDEPVGHVYDSGVIRQSAANIAERRFTAYCRYRKMLILRRAHAF